MPKPKARTPKKPRHKKRRNPAFDRENYHLPVRSEAEQLEGLPEELQDAWRALRKFIASLGDQPSHTSAKSIMFYGKRCYAFVRPKKKFLELTFFLGHAVKSELLKKVEATSKTRWAHVMAVVHADQIEEPLTDWLREAREISNF